jgi:hypothetical protein
MSSWNDLVNIKRHADFGCFQHDKLMMAEEIVLPPMVLP